MNAVIDKLPALIDEELAAANAKHPPFHSPHEGYAVIKEEIEETDAELESAKRMVVLLWGSIKDDDLYWAGKTAIEIKAKAKQAAAEAIQVAAMAQKMLDYLNYEKE